MGREPLAENGEITDLRNWLERVGVNSLYDLSKWDHRGDWAGWDFLGVPPRLSQQQSTLVDLLEEASPVNRFIKDRWGWGKTGVYTTTTGYRALQVTRNTSHTPAFWKRVWDHLSIPKVNFFFWTLMHNQILTGDNLEKRNIVGPHRCVLCNNNSETSQHLSWISYLPKRYGRFFFRTFRFLSHLRTRLQSFSLHGIQYTPSAFRLNLSGPKYGQ